MKRIFERAEDSSLALLEVRNTSTAGMSTSPAERLLCRSIRSILLTENGGYTDKSSTKIYSKKEQQRN